MNDEKKKYSVRSILLMGVFCRYLSRKVVDEILESPQGQKIGGQVLIGESTYKLVEDMIKADAPRNVMMKGMKQPLVFYSVNAIQAGFEAALDFPVKKKGSLDIRLPFQCWTIDSKKIDGIPMLGETVSISDRQIKVKISSDVKPFADLKIRFDFCLDAHCFGDMYVKNRSQEKQMEKKIKVLEITSIEQKDKKILHKWISQGIR